MSTKELAYSLIDRLTERQLEAIVEILKGLSLPQIPETEPDEWDVEMIKRAEEENDGETINIEDFARELGIDYDRK
ncbi:MAG: hypothetical protein K2J11_13070 [Oscillospiraceae bacterium]|nr:hypothetical protein [Oscillospiraceae bacterium]